MKGQYSKATRAWENLYEDFVKYPELMFALGNALYFKQNFDNSTYTQFGKLMAKVG